MDKAFNVLGTIMVVAFATTLVLPGRQTPAVIERTFTGLSKLTNTAIGRG